MTDYVKYTEDRVKLFIPRAKLAVLRKKYPDRFFEDFGILIRKNGVALRKWKHGEDYERIQTFVKYKDLDAILRFLGKHYPKSNRKEYRKLNKLKKMIKKLNQALEKWESLSTVKREVISKKLSDWAQKLPDPAFGKNELKRKARLDLLRVHDFKDRREQINPGATRAVLVGVNNRLEQRIEQLERIRFKYELKRILLESIRRKFEKRFMKAETKLRAIRKSLKKNKLPRDALRKIQREIKKELTQFLGKITEVPPYAKYFSELRQLLSSELNNTKIKRAIEETEKALKHIREQQAQNIHK